MFFPTPHKTYYTRYRSATVSGFLLGCTLHCRGVNGHTVPTCTRSSAYSYRSTTHAGISIIIDDIICGRRILLGISSDGSGVQGILDINGCTEEAGSRRGITDISNVISEWLVPFKDFRCKCINI